MDHVHHPRPILLVNRRLFSNRALKAVIVALLIERLLQLVVGIADTTMVSCASKAMALGASLDTAIYTIFITLPGKIASGFGAFPENSF